MTILTEFILARTAEREAVARACSGAGPWHEEAANVHGADGSRLATVERAYRGALPVAAHIALNDPAHVLAWCETVRRIVEGYLDMVRQLGELPDKTLKEGVLVAGVRGIVRALGGVLCDLATVYADHPDYDSAWAV